MSAEIAVPRRWMTERVDVGEGVTLTVFELFALAESGHIDEPEMGVALGDRTPHQRVFTTLLRSCHALTLREIADRVETDSYHAGRLLNDMRRRGKVFRIGRFHWSTTANDTVPKPGVCEREGCSERVEANRRFCSSRCVHGARPTKTKACEREGCEGRAKTSQRFCSRGCFEASTKRAAARCSHCSEPIPRERRSHATCSDACAVERRKKTDASFSKTPEEVRARRREAQRVRYKGADKAEVIARLTAEQDGRCAICGGEGEAPRGRRSGLVLDHCHASGKARAMLCGRCNTGLGMARENPAVLEAMAAYARRWGASEPVNAGIHPSDPCESRWDPLESTCRHASLSIL